MLFHAVGVQEGPGDIHDVLPVPLHGEAALVGNGGHHGGLQVFRGGQLHEPGGVLGLHHHSHSLLGFADGKLGAVQALVLLGHGVQVDLQALGQLTDGNGDAAGAEIVAALNESGGLGVAEQALELALLGGVALLDLSSAAFQGLHGVGLGGAGGAAAAVPAGAAAQEDHHVPGIRTLPADIFRRSGGDNRADLHALGSVAGVIELVHLAGGKADLVAVGAVARGGLGDNSALRELALHGLVDGGQGVGRAGDPHGGVHIGPAGQGVPDGAAHAGGGPAEGLNFRGVVVGLVLKEQQPVLLAPCGVHLDLHRAGVDLLGLVQLGHFPLLFQVLGNDGANVHQVNGLGAV